MLQDQEHCGPEGWDCLENNAKSNFSCMVTCQGIYADVQVLTEQTPAGKEKMEDMEKVSRLLEQYNEFKKKNLPNFRFNASAESEYGNVLINNT